MTKEACRCELSAIEAEDAWNWGTNMYRRRMQAFKDAFVPEYWSENTPQETCGCCRMRTGECQRTTMRMDRRDGLRGGAGAC